MSCVIAVDVSIFQTVQVVSIEDVTTRLGDFSFHEKLVKGAPVLLFWTLLCCEEMMVRTQSYDDGCLEDWMEDRET